MTLKEAAERFEKCKEPGPHCSSCPLTAVSWSTEDGIETLSICQSLAYAKEELNKVEVTG